MTMTITTTYPAGPGRRHAVVSAPNYVLRRVVAVAVLAVAVVIVVLLAATLAAVGGEPAAASDAAASSSAAVHVARPGDTLWSIAARHRGGVDHGRYVEALIDLNGGTAIEVGQAIRLP